MIFASARGGYCYLSELTGLSLKNRRIRLKTELGVKPWTRIEKAVQNEREKGHYIRPFTSAELEAIIRPFQTSPISIIPKPGCLGSTGSFETSLLVRYVPLMRPLFPKISPPHGAPSVTLILFSDSLEVHLVELPTLYFRRLDNLLISYLLSYLFKPSLLLHNLLPKLPFISSIRHPSL